MDREAQLSRTFVQLADTLVKGYDVVDLLYFLCERSVELLEMTAAGVLLTNDGGDLQLVAASSGAMRVLELFEMQNAEGPCPDAFRTGEQVLEQDLENTRQRWTRFTPRALDTGFRSVCAFPIALRDERIGALNLFRTDPGTFEEADIQVAQALADMAAIGILQERAVRDVTRRSEQLQHALTSRVVIEQAKGIVSERLGLDVEAAFETIRGYTRSHGRRLREVAQEIVDGQLPEGMARRRD